MSDLVSSGVAVVLTILTALAVGVVLAWWAWHNAPAVGGEWWFYIRIIITIIVGWVGLALGSVVGWAVGAIVVFLDLLVGGDD